MCVLGACLSIPTYTLKGQYCSSYDMLSSWSIFQYIIRASIEHCIRCSENFFKWLKFLNTCWWSKELTLLKEDLKEHCTLSALVGCPRLLCLNLVINRIIIGNYRENYSERLPEPMVIILLACYLSFVLYSWMVVHIWSLFVGEILVFLWKPRKLETTMKLFRK